ncbi:MAG: PLP-dependent aminotransferase family protein [Clostridia bacterium]|nr:PLP-dependent aminotransferase family protein [Clostridia bacterium]
MGRTAYGELYEKIRREIISGGYPYGSRLPGKRVLAEQNGISVITAAHALEMLADEGYVEMRERSGCYAAYRASDDFPGREPEEPSRREMPEVPSSADVDGISFALLAKRIRGVLAEQGEKLLEKTPNQGLLLLRQSLSGYLARSRGILAEPEQIILGAGAEYLYGLLTEILGGERIWAIEQPSYEKIEQVYAARGIRLDRLPLGRNGLQSEPLRRTKAGVLHISPYRSYPSDVTASASKRAEYLKWGEEEGRVIIEDDYESEFAIQRKPMDTLFSQAVRGNVIYLNSFSRTISSSLRAGYMVLPKNLLPLYHERAGFYSCTVPALEQYLLASLLDSGDFERHIRRVRRKLRAGEVGQGKQER